MPVSYNSNAGNQLNAARFGLDVYKTQQAGNTSAINAGNSIQQTPYNNWQNFNSQANQAGGNGGTSSNTTNMPGNAALGALGGWQIGQAFSKSQTPAVDTSNYGYA